MHDTSAKLDPDLLDPENFCGSGLKVHPVANMFPLIDGKEFVDLCEDIASRGLLNPIVVSRGVLIDGRNRLHACAARDVEPVFREYSWQAEAEDEWIVSQNIHRRSLTPDQRAAIALKAFDWRSHNRLAKLVKAGAMKKANDARLNRSPEKRDASLSPERGTTRGREAVEVKIQTKAGVSKRKAENVMYVGKHAPDLLDQVLSGKLALVEAERIARQRPQAPAPKRPPKWNTATAVRQAGAFIHRLRQRCPNKDVQEVRSALIAIVRENFTK